jgi:hypothetical protein
VQACIPASLRASVDERLAAAAQARVAARLREGDATLWGAPGTPEVADRLGWLTIAERELAELGALRALTAKIKRADRPGQDRPGGAHVNQQSRPDAGSR